MTQSLKRLTLGFRSGHDLAFVRWNPTSDSVLTARSLLGIFSLSLYLSLKINLKKNDHFPSPFRNTPVVPHLFRIKTNIYVAMAYRVLQSLSYPPPVSFSFHLPLSLLPQDLCVGFCLSLEAFPLPST